MNTLEREHIGEHSGLLEACKHLLAETKDPVTAAWLKSECEAAKTRPGLFQAEIEAILTIIKPSHEHADLFALLELEPGAGREAIKRNYRRLSRRYHPDSGGSKEDEDTFIRITQAYQRLLASADSTPGELPTPRRENSHWRNSVVAGTSDLRRAQKRRNVVVVALLSLTLIFVSLLAARTYNSRVMMSGLKNKGVAFVPPTPTTAATTPTPKSPEGHTANDGYAARTNGTPTSTTTTAATDQTEPTTKPTTTAATDQTEPTTKPITAAATDRAVSTENTPSPTTTTATAILPAEPAAHPETLVSLTPAARKQPVSPAHAEPGTPTTPTAEPAAQPTVAATQPSAAAHAATAGQTAHTESTPPAPTIATTTAQPPRTPSPQPPPPPKPTPSTPTLTATQSQPAPTTTDHQPPSPESVVAANAAPQPPTASQTRERIDTFLHAYTAAYEQKNLPTFTRFFATNATENGKPLTDVLSAYAELFHSAETLRFTVSPDQYEHNQGHLHLRGRFTIAMTFKDEGTKSGQGEITFRLTDTTPPQVQTLRYTFDQ